MSKTVKPVHFTYKPIGNGESDLCQGDILQPTAAMRTLLGEVHPHFQNDKYVAFLVLTQTCDLVRRDRQPCKSRYINLAVVRSLRNVLPTFLNRACDKVEICGKRPKGFYIEETKYRAEQLLRRIFNQNAQAEGIFYLHPDAAVGIAESSVALLQVSVAVRSHEHYDKLVTARSGQLAEQFQSKLGWLIGNLFSRVATKDLSVAKRRELVSDFLDSIPESFDEGPWWIPQKKIRAAKGARVDVSGMTTSEIAAVLDRHKPTPPRDVAIERVAVVLRSTIADISEEHIRAVKDKLISDAIFESACK